MSSPGRIWYVSAILLGKVTWYLDVTLAMAFPALYPYHSEDRFLVQRQASPCHPNGVPDTRNTKPGQVNVLQIR